MDVIVSLSRLLLRSAAASAVRMMPGADFPDAFRANLWVRGMSQDKSAEEALSDFKVDASCLLCPHCTWTHSDPLRVHIICMLCV